MKRKTPTPEWELELRRLKAQWRDQVAHDHDLRPAAFKIAYFMADYVTMDKSKLKFHRQGKMFIWPSQRDLCSSTCFSRETVGESIRQLIEQGHLKKLRAGNQFTGSSKYRLLMKEAAPKEDSGKTRHAVA